MKPHIVTEDMRLRARDGQELEGKLYLPRDGVVSRLVVQVNGSGPQTCNTFRDRGDGTTYSFCGFFGEELAGRGLGFFCYSTRGCTDGDQGPLYCRVDRAVYRSYTPQTCVADLEDWTALLQAHPRCAGAELLLLGWSEGTMIAPAVAAGGAVPLAGLLLAGYANGTMEEALEATFSGLDLDGDGRITPADLEAVYAGSRAEIFRAIEAGDDEWLWEHYPVPLTTNWFRGHRRFPPNRETLPRLDLPIHILQGRWDANTPAEDALAIQETFRRLGKDNLAVHIYPDAGHALGFEQYLATGELPPALTDLFELCQGLGR